MNHLVWPNGSITEPARSDGYGPRPSIETKSGLTRPFHVGADHYNIGRICAIGDGVVVESGWVDWAGYQVLIYLGEIDGVRAWVRFCHLRGHSPLSRGDTVRRGDFVGVEGSTGQAAGDHLHWEIYLGRVNRGSWDDTGSTVDPRAFVRAHLLPVKTILEASMSNPIISVPDGRGTLYIGTDKGEFVQYATPRAMNSRGIISKVFYGGPGGDEDTIPALGWNDFEVAKTVWRQMCTGK